MPGKLFYYYIEVYADHNDLLITHKVTATSPRTAIKKLMSKLKEYNGPISRVSVRNAIPKNEKDRRKFLQQSIISKETQRRERVKRALERYDKAAGWSEEDHETIFFDPDHDENDDLL